MTPEELYKKEFGDADSVPKESVIRLLQHFAKVLQIERQQVTAGGMVSVCLADFFSLPLPLMANCTIPLVTNWAVF